MELRDYVRIVRKGWILIVAIMLVAIGAAAAYSFLKTPEYSAGAKVFVSVQSNDTVSDLVQGNTFTQNRVKSYAELVTTPAVLRPVIDDLDLDTTVQELARRLTATAPLDTSLIQIDATSTDPTEAADLANATSQSLAEVVEDLESPQSDAVASPVRITQVTDAIVPAGPESPNIPLNLALGLLIGLALGLGVAVLRETLDTRIRGEHDVQPLTPSPIVGGIALDAKAEERPLVVHDDPRSIRAESFRTLRTNFQFLGGEGRRSFVFTSAMQGEGKTTTVANLAIALADAGRSVVVIDADLRRPRLADILGLEGAVGLSDLLIGRADFDDVVQTWGRGGLEVLAAGRVPPNPSELLGSTAMVELIARLEQRYEYVLFDAAPLLPVTDAAVLSMHVGGAIVMVAAGRTRKAQLRGTLAALENVEVAPAGIVLTMLPTKGPDAYGYGYGYGYDEGAVTEQPEIPASEAVIPRPADPVAGQLGGPRRRAGGDAEDVHGQDQPIPRATIVRRRSTGTDEGAPVVARAVDSPVPVSGDADTEAETAPPAPARKPAVRKPSSPRTPRATGGTARSSSRRETVDASAASTPAPSKRAPRAPAPKTALPQQSGDADGAPVADGGDGATADITILSGARRNRSANGGR